MDKMMINYYISSIQASTADNNWLLTFLAFIQSSPQLNYNFCCQKKQNNVKRPSGKNGGNLKIITFDMANKFTQFDILIRSY